VYYHPQINFTSLSQVLGFGLLWATAFVFDDAYTPRNAHSPLAITEAIKLLIAVAGHWRLSRNTRYQNSYQELALDESDGHHGLLSTEHEPSATRPSIRNRKVSMVYALIVASLYVSRNLVVRLTSVLESLKYLILVLKHLKLQHHLGPLSLGLVLPATTLTLMVVLRLCFARRFSLLQYSGALLQVGQLIIPVVGIL
jgi:hypothetical protein